MHSSVPQYDYARVVACLHQRNRGGGGIVSADKWSIDSVTVISKEGERSTAVWSIRRYVTANS